MWITTGLALLLFAVGLIAGCSGSRPSPNTLEKNLRIQTETESGSIFSNTRVHLGIYRVDAQCQIEYEGTIDLDKPVVFVALPSDRLSYLVFGFFSSSLPANARRSISQATLLNPPGPFLSDRRQLSEQHLRRSRSGASSAQEEQPRNRTQAPRRL